MANNKTSPLKYELLTAQIQEMITSGTLGAGSRLPSIRDLARMRGLSIFTVQQALARLEDTGFVEAHKRSGYYVRKPSNTDVPASGRYLKQSRAVQRAALIREAMRSSQADEISLAGAYPSTEWFPLDRLRREMARVVRQSPNPLGQLSPVPGALELRKEIAHHMLRWGCTLQPEQVVVTTGGHESILLALSSICKSGDVVVVESPTYYVLLQILETLGLKALEVPVVSSGGMDLDALEQLLKHGTRPAACVVMTTGSNPSGASLNLSNKERLVRILERHRVPLIEDFVYGDLHFQGENIAAKHFDRNGNVLICTSLNKTLAPGIRLGWVASERHAEKIANLKWYMGGAQSLASELAATAMFHSGGYVRHLRHLHFEIARQIRRFRAAVIEAFPASVKVSDPSAGYVLWVELDKKCDSMKLYHRCREHGFMIAPGQIFSARDQYCNYIRLNGGITLNDTIQSRLKLLGRIIEQAARK